MKTLHYRLGLAAIALVAPLFLSASQPTPIQPGYWESTNRLLSPVRKTTVEKRCITAADVSKFMEGPHNHIYVCTYPTRIVENGKILLKGSCRDKKGFTVSLQGHGAYTPTTLSVTAIVQLAGIPLSAEASTEAHRIGDVCPANSIH